MKLRVGTVERWLAGEETPPNDVDRSLVRLAQDLALGVGETLTAALAIEVERSALVGRLLAWMQAPVGGSRPTLGLLADGLSSVDPEADVAGLAAGPAIGTGLLELSDPQAPLPERSVALPSHLFVAVAGGTPRVEGARVEEVGDHVPQLPPSIVEGVRRHAVGLRAGRRQSVCIRSGHPDEARMVAGALARALGARPLFVDRWPVVGLVPWLHLSRAVPVFVRRMAPGERWPLPSLHGWEGPIIVATGPDGSVVAAEGCVVSWSVPTPPREERVTLWEDALGDPSLASRLARSHRHGVARIAELGRLAWQHAAMDQVERPDERHVDAAAWHGDGGGLETLAQPVRDRVGDAVLILGNSVRSDLDHLLARCAQREDLADGLGPAAGTRYRSGVKALFVGPSGTGKTLAAAWLATRLAMPLYRVDMASVVSKYIGETEQNLAELLARAEAAEVVLFFDEADTLFGKRTEVRHSTDRFANSQTNYLLQRIESYEGIVVLASNSRARFDSAFNRRLDLVVEFPPPNPEERRALWEAHLGNDHAASARDLNELAARSELGGGHIRNAVLAAAVIARQAGRPIGRADLVRGLEIEHRKAGRPLPGALLRSPKGV